MTETRDDRDDARSRRAREGTVRPPTKPIEQIYRENVITKEELAKLHAGEERRPDRDIPARYRHLAEKYAGFLLPQEVEKWLDSSDEPRPWLVICNPKPTIADVIAGRVMLDQRLDCYRDGALLLVAEFAERCNSAPRYGEGCIDDIIAKTAAHKLLVISGLGGRTVPRSAALVHELSRLLERRLARLLPTVIVELSQSEVWAEGMRKAGASADDVGYLRTIIVAGVKLPAVPRVHPPRKSTD